MAATILKDPNTVLYDSTPILGCQAITVNDTSGVDSRISDAGTITPFNTAGPITGVLTFQDAIEAEKVANKSDAAKNITAIVKDADGADKTLTLTGVKTGGVTTNFATNVPGQASVAYVAASKTLT